MSNVNLLVWPCRRLSVHEPHEHQAKVARASHEGPAWCPGVEHDHEKRCCVEHQHHVMPHRGCVLR